MRLSCKHDNGRTHGFTVASDAILPAERAPKFSPDADTQPDGAVVRV